MRAADPADAREMHLRSLAWWSQHQTQGHALFSPGMRLQGIHAKRRFPVKGDSHVRPLLSSPGTTPEQDRGAALTLADRAQDAAELALFLEMCGMREYESTPNPHGWKGGKPIVNYERPGR
jgi:hypothetical protein